MLEGYALNKDREEKLNNQLKENRQNGEFWLLMDVINVIQEKFIKYRRQLNEAENNGDKEYEKQYYFQQVAACEIETDIWKLHDEWEALNGIEH